VWGSLRTIPYYEARREIRAPAAPPIRGNGDNAGLLKEHAGSAWLRAGHDRDGKFHLEIVHQELFDDSGLQQRLRLLRGRRQPACPHSGLGGRLGIVAEGSPFWQWAIETLVILTWTWLANDDGYWAHPHEANVRRPISNDKTTSEEKLRALLESDKVNEVLFDKVAPRANQPVWSSSSIKVAIWLAGTKDHGPPDGWIVEHWVIDHAVFGGVSRGQFHVRGVTRSEDPPFSKLEMVGVSTKPSHVTDVTIGKGREYPRSRGPPLELMVAEAMRSSSLITCLVLAATVAAGSSHSAAPTLLAVASRLMLCFPGTIICRPEFIGCDAAAAIPSQAMIRYLSMFIGE
jgi:hypothetical protein